MSAAARGVQSLGAEEISTRPQLGEDLFRSINRLTGVSSNDFAAGFHTRGAEIDQMYVSLDGMQLYEPFHLKDLDGALSILDVQSVGGVDLSTGGFTSEYGNRLGSALAIRSAEPSDDAARTALGISVTNLRVQSQGKFSSGQGSWLVAARRGYLDLAFKLAGVSDSISPAYSDVFAKTSFGIGGRNRLTVDLLRADDELTYNTGKGLIKSAYASTYAWATWNTDPTNWLSGTTIVSMAHLRWSRNLRSPPKLGLVDTASDTRTFATPGVQQNWSLVASPYLTMRAGAELRSESASYDYHGLHSTIRVIDDSVVVASHALSADLLPRGSRVGAYVAPRIRPASWLTTEIGLRYDRVSYTGDGLWSPRANVLLALGPRTSVRLADGRYDQPQSIYSLQVQDGVTHFAQADRAEHRVIGIDQILDSATSVRAEAYERITTRESPGSSICKPARMRCLNSLPDRVLLSASGGRARGVELTVRHHVALGLDWSANYAWARTTDMVEGQQVPRTYDQEHTAYVDASYRAPASGLASQRRLADPLGMAGSSRAVRGWYDKRRRRSAHERGCTDIRPAGRVGGCAIAVVSSYRYSRHARAPDGTRTCIVVCGRVQPLRQLESARLRLFALGTKRRAQRLSDRPCPGSSVSERGHLLGILTPHSSARDRCEFASACHPTNHHRTELHYAYAACHCRRRDVIRLRERNDGCSRRADRRGHLSIDRRQR